MSMGAYDDEEHERRAQKTGQVDTDFSDMRTEYKGRIEFDSGESTDALLDQFKEIKGN